MLVNVTSEILALSKPWADSSTICARRQVTTDPEDRRTIRNNRWPSSGSISRTRTLRGMPGRREQGKRWLVRH
jgi:hypothetical protein